METEIDQPKPQSQKSQNEQVHVEVIEMAQVESTPTEKQQNGKPYHQLDIHLDFFMRKWILDLSLEVLNFLKNPASNVLNNFLIFPGFQPGNFLNSLVQPHNFF